MKKELIIAICFIAALCNSGYSGHNVRFDENLLLEDDLHGAVDSNYYHKKLLSGKKAVLPKSFADSLYSFLSEKISYRIVKDTTQWKFMSKDYLRCAPFPLPSGYSQKDSIEVVYDYNGVPVVRRIFTGDDSLVVIVHSKGDSQILVSLWKDGNCNLIQKGRTHSFYVNEDVDGAVSIIGNECIAIGHPRCSFGLYKIGLDSMPCIYSDTLTTDTGRYVGFYPGDHAGRFGVFAAETRKAGTSGWEQLFLYYWNGKECLTIPIPGIGDSAIAKNHVSECCWLEPRDSTDQSYVELLIKRQYIEESLPSRVYCFDRQKWTNTSEKHKDFITKNVNDWRYGDSYLIMYDSAFAIEWMKRNADTIDASARRIRYYGYKMSHTGYIGKLFPAGLYYFCRGNWDSAFTLIKMLNTPWGMNDDRELSSAKQLQTIKEYLISCGDMTSCGFADSLFAYIRTIRHSDFGKPIEKKTIGGPGDLPHSRLKAFVDSLWPHALDEVESLRKYQMAGQKIIMTERALHDSLSILAENLTHRPSAEKVESLFQPLLNWYAGKNMQVLVFAEGDGKIRELLRTYATEKIKKLFKEAKENTGKGLPGDIIHSILLNYCDPQNSDFAKKIDIRYDTLNPLETSRLLTYGLCLGDSSALKCVDLYLSRNDAFIDTFVYSLFNPDWGCKPPASACAFGFETVWKKRPNAETVTQLAPGLAETVIYSSGNNDAKKISLRHAFSLIEENKDPQLKYLFMMLFHMNLMEQMQKTGLTTDKIFKDAGVSADTFYAIVNQMIQTGKQQDGFDLRDVISGLQDNGKVFIDWLIADGALEEDREYVLELILSCGLRGYDSLMNPVECDTSFQQKDYSINNLDVCYLLRFGSKKSRKELLKRYGNEAFFQEVAPYFRLSLLTSKKEIKKEIDKLTLYDPDTLDSEHWRDVDWASNNYLMLVPNPRIDEYKWKYLYIFDSFSTSFAAKTWLYYILVNEFRDRHSRKEIIGRVSQYDFPWEFAFDIMTIRDLREHSSSYSKDPISSESDMFWEAPLIEQVLSHRLLRNGDVNCMLRFLPKYDYGFNDFINIIKQ